MVGSLSGRTFGQVLVQKKPRSAPVPSPSEYTKETRGVQLFRTPIASRRPAAFAVGGPSMYNIPLWPYSYGSSSADGGDRLRVFAQM